MFLSDYIIHLCNVQSISGWPLGFNDSEVRFKEASERYALIDRYKGKLAHLAVFGMIVCWRHGRVFSVAFLLGFAKINKC